MYASSENMYASMIENMYASSENMYASTYASSESSKNFYTSRDWKPLCNFMKNLCKYDLQYIDGTLEKIMQVRLKH